MAFRFLASAYKAIERDKLISLHQSQIMSNGVSVRFPTDIRLKPRHPVPVSACNYLSMQFNFRYQGDHLG